MLLNFSKSLTWGSLCDQILNYRRFVVLEVQLSHSKLALILTQLELKLILSIMSALIISEVDCCLKLPIL